MFLSSSCQIFQYVFQLARDSLKHFPDGFISRCLWPVILYIHTKCIFILIKFCALIFIIMFFSFFLGSAGLICRCDVATDRDMFVWTDGWYARNTSVCTQCLMCDGDHCERSIGNVSAFVVLRPSRVNPVHPQAAGSQHAPGLKQRWALANRQSNSTVRIGHC